tara:strand:+ start:65 stop:472 length:408 start_codon:yes stop_codon:yes gene_type:complete
MRLSLSKTIALAFSIFGLSLTISPGAEYVDSYQATFSRSDFFSSSGEKLSGAASIIQQDRANYYKFNKRDATDTASQSRFFQSAKNRAKISAMVNSGVIKNSDIDSDFDYGTVVEITIMKSNNGQYYLRLTLIAG